MTFHTFDDTPCELGEGPLWHPELGQLFWFDITGKKLLTRQDGQTNHWDFDEHVSAAGWIDANSLMIASETALSVFDLETGESQYVCALELDNPITRSNDGRADPMGGFWIGTMGKNAEKKAGAIYRYYRGELRKLFGQITISNSICFAPDGSCGYFSDTVTGRIMRVALDDEGWPKGEPSVAVERGIAPGSPDGSVTDAEGNIWNARWGGWQVACFSPQGALLREVAVGGAHASCPAFGGADLTSLYVTTALQGISAENAAKSPDNGKVFEVLNVAKGLPEPRVIL